MLFALIDYYRYRTQHGIYSPAYIEGRNGRLLTPKNFPDMSIFEAGDIFFTHRRVSMTSWAVMYLTASPWAHTGTFSGNGNILEAVTQGVIEHPFTDYLDGRSYMSVYKMSYLDNESREKAIKFERSQLGTPYNWLGVIRLGINILIGRHDHYHPKLLGDVLITLGVLTLPALRWRPWAFITSATATAYLSAVVCNSPIREDMRRTMNAPLRRDA